MSVKAKQTIFEVEPEVYNTEYNQGLFAEHAFKEKLRFKHKADSVLALWPTTQRVWDSKPFAFGFIDYRYP